MLHESKQVVYAQKLEHFLTPHTKINSKWIKDLNVRPETIQLLEENISKPLSDINHSRILYDPPSRILEIKVKINKWDLIKIKSFCKTKETISKVKRQPSEWEKIMAISAPELPLSLPDFTIGSVSSTSFILFADADERERVWNIMLNIMTEWNICVR